MKINSMIRETIIPSDTIYPLPIPEEWIGKNVIVEYEKEPLEKNNGRDMCNTASNSIQTLREVFDKNRVDLKSFIFNREEANRYE